MRQLRFKTGSSQQLMLLPPSLEELIPSDHIVRVVNTVIDGLDLSTLLNRYKSGGTSSYHPRMLLKILVYGYLNNTYSSRRLEEATQSNIHFMWLSGMQRPDHNTINRFRGQRLQGLLKPIFVQIVELLVASDLVSLKKLYVDGTKIEGNANKYTFVWAKSIKTNKEKMLAQLEELWAYTAEVTKEEETSLDLSSATLDSTQIKETITKINEKLSSLESDEAKKSTLLKDETAKKKHKKIKAKIRYADRNWGKKLDDYKEKETILNGRSSYSKTDTDATFMRMKEDHMKNGQLKPGYNLQMSTEDQYILNYGLYPNPNDTLTFPNHLDDFEDLYHQTPVEVIADSGYGSHENYDYLEQKGITAYVKYNFFHKDLKQEAQREKGKALKQPFQTKWLFYNKEQDFFICPMGQRMEKKYHTKKSTSSGFIQEYSVYQAKNCNGCPLRGSCHKSKEHRKITFNHQLQQHKIKAKEKLTSEKGKAHRSQRPADVEAVFGNIKQNKKFRRFNLRGKEKATVEIGLISIAHNLAKYAKYAKKAA